MPLRRDAVIDAALALIDADGRAALSARRVAAAVGCEAMSLYHHFANMAAVEDAVADRLLAAVPRPQAAHGWSAVAAFASAYLDLAERHPAAFPLLATRPWRGAAAEALAAALERAFAMLTPDPRLAVRRTRVIRAYLDGAGLTLARLAGTPEVQRVEVAALRADLDAGVTQLVASMRARVVSRAI